MKCLVLTGTIDPSTYSNTGVKLTDVNQRYNQYKNALEYYINESLFKKIIFVENSGYNFDQNYFIDLCKKKSKFFELIQIKVDVKETIKRGKSYGEAACIKQAILHSQLLKGEKSFYKITGRIKLKNVNKICNDNDDLSKFVLLHDVNYCLTFFFKTNILDYKNYFWDVEAYLNDYEAEDIESVFYKRIVGSEIKMGSFNVFPYPVGIIGTYGVGEGNTYQDVWAKNYWLKCIKMRMGFYSKQPSQMLLRINLIIRHLKQSVMLNFK